MRRTDDHWIKPSQRNPVANLDPVTPWVSTGFMLERPRRLSIRIADDEWTMLYALAEAEGITASDYIRLFIRREHASRFRAAKVKTPRSKRARSTK